MERQHFYSILIIAIRMKTKTLTEAVSQITGKTVTDNEAKIFARDQYIELCFFHRYEVNMIAEKANQLKARKAKRELFKKMYHKN